jgi:hypothetical protein
MTGNANKKEKEIERERKGGQKRSKKEKGEKHL